MELRTLIRLASEIIAYYWPMRTFVHHNPLHGLEHLPFDEAVQMAQRSSRRQRLFVRRNFSRLCRAGRILPRHLDAVLKTIARSQQVKLGSREVSHLDVLRACLLGDTSARHTTYLDTQLTRHPDRNTIATLTDQLASLPGNRNPAESLT